jgi:hypothetical protein
MKTLLKISLLLFFLASCQSKSQIPVSPTETVQPTETLSPQIQARQNEITSIWEDSAHARASNPVRCEDCHQTQNGIVLEEVSWRDQQTGQYEAVFGINSPCRQCHENTSAGRAHMTFTCTDCHDPHRISASCTDSGCHSDIPTVFYELPATPTGGHPNIGSSFCGEANCHPVATAVAETTGSIHGPEHALVTCGACHAASQSQAGPLPDDGKWVTWQEVESNGEVLNESRFPHNIQLEVVCARCHFENNPWELNLVIGR